MGTGDACIPCSPGVDYRWDPLIDYLLPLGGRDIF